jgi:thiamine-monophosphate kinase
MKLKQQGEIKILEALIPLVTKVKNNVLLGPGDDCAIIKMPENKKYELLLKVDSTIETVHFEKNAPPCLIGKKALGKVMSDFAAMGGKPLWALISLVAPPNTEISKLKKIYSGINQLASKYKVAITGGDTSRGKLLELHIFCAGIVKKGKAILRTGAKIGDLLYVTGTLGGSRYGKHLDFKPRINEGLWLAENNIASAMIDITDGLLMDLNRILKANNKSCCLYVDKIPASPTLQKNNLSKKNTLQHALTDGEDFELLFTVPPSRAAVLEKKWRFKTKLALIGKINKQRNISISFLNTKINQPENLILKSCGYEHFKK